MIESVMAASRAFPPEPEKRAMRRLLDLLGGFRVGLLVVAVLILLYLSTAVVPAGHVGVKDFFGQVSDKVLQPGISLVLPGTRVLRFSVQTREIKETAAVPTSEGLIVNLDVSLLFRLRPDAAARIYKTVGRQFEQVVIDPQLRSAIRDVTAEYEAKFLYSASREMVAQNMFRHMKNALDPRGIEAEQVLLRSVQLPPLLTTAIQEKLQAEQQHSGCASSSTGATGSRAQASRGAGYRRLSDHRRQGHQRRAAEVEGDRGCPRAVEEPEQQDHRARRQEWPADHPHR
jgi:regulator of protease activity HflC (stomatin/prohibitin superfamily)